MGFISDVGFLPQAVATTFGFNDYISWLLPLVTIKQICMHFFLQCTFCRTWVQHMCGSRLHEQYPNINQHNTLYLSSPTCPYFKLSSWLLKVLLEKNFYIKIIGRKIRNLCSYLAIVYNFFFFFLNAGNYEGRSKHCISSVLIKKDLVMLIKKGSQLWRSRPSSWQNIVSDYDFLDEKALQAVIWKLEKIIPSSIPIFPFFPHPLQESCLAVFAFCFSEL